MKNTDYSFLLHGSVMGQAIRNFNWATTSLGPIEHWPAHLRTATAIMLSNPLPMFIAWGEGMMQLHNDAYLSLPTAFSMASSLGSPVGKNLAGSWATVGPLLEGAMHGMPMGKQVSVKMNSASATDTFFLNFNSSPLLGENGHIDGLLITMVEATEKFKIEQELLHIKEELHGAQQAVAKEKERLNHFFMHAPAGICILDGPDFVYELVNPAYQQLFPGRELQGKSLLEAFPELAGSPIYDVLTDVYQHKKPFTGKEFKIALPEREGNAITNRFFNFLYQPRISPGGDADGIMVLAYEVTDLVLAREQLQQSESRFRNIVDQSPVPILVTMGEDHVFTEFNEAMLVLLDKDETIRNKKASEVLPELEGQPIMDILNHTFRTRKKWQGSEYPIALHRNGKISTGYFNLTYKPFINDGKIVGVLQSAVDISEQVHARKALEKTEDTLRLSMRAGKVGLFDLDLENNELHWDERCRELFGTSHDQPISYEKDFVEGMHLEDRNRILKVIEEYTMVQELSNGDYDEEYRTVGTTDGKVRWIRAMGKVYFNALQQPVRFLGTVIDITETKENELLKNDFIGMVSHELKTPLTSLKAYLQIMQDGSGDDAGAGITPMLHKADNQVNKMNQLIGGFLDVARLESGKIVLHKTKFDLAKLIDETILDVMISNSGHTIDFTIQQPLIVTADRDKIASVITNLLTNAIKYSSPESTITITYQIENNHAKVLVADEGIGIRQVHLPHVFERFYRVNDGNKLYASGFGIGLYLSAEVIKRHAGKLSVDSEFGKGACFSFVLPMNEEVIEKMT